MRGLYLYCIRLNSGKGLQVKGIDGKSKAMGIPYKEIEAIVSNVDLKEYGSKELAQRANGDLKWIIKHAKRHEKVIEHAMNLVRGREGSQRASASNGVKDRGEIIPIIPMKFGMIFEKPQKLEDILKKEYRKFKKLLSRFTGNQEWSVKIYAKVPTLREKLKSSEKKVQTQIKQAKGLPRGTDYFGELEINKALDTVMQKKSDAISKKFLKILSEFAVDSRSGKILAQEFTGHKEPMILNSAYLIKGSKVGVFIKQVRSFQKIHPEFIFEYTGPWPPYNFI
jgi:hypothetical protein